MNFRKYHFYQSGHVVVKMFVETGFKKIFELIYTLLEISCGLATAPSASSLFSFRGGVSKKKIFF